MSILAKTPWTQLGQKLQGDSIKSIENAITSANLDWQAEKVKLITEDTHSKTDAYAIRKSDDKSILGVVGHRYTVLQNKEAFSCFQDFLNAGEATLDSAGSFEEGRIVWILAKINRDPIVVAKDDEILKYILLSHSHDGKMSVRFGFTPIRISCQNTLSMAHDKDISKLIRIRHNSQVHRNLSDISSIMNVANQEFEASGERYKYLATRTINRSDLMRYIKIVLEVDETVGMTKMEEASLSDIMFKFENGYGNDNKAIAGTWWAAYNGVTEWLSHSKGRNTDSRINSLWLGNAAVMNHKALDLAVQMAN